MEPQELSAADGGMLPLSLSQREVWMDQRAWPGDVHLNIGGGFMIERVDVERFRQALVLLVAENEALRLAPLADGTQTLLAHYEPTLEVIDLGAAADPEIMMRAWWQKWMTLPFDLDGTPPWRFALLRADGCDDGLTIQFHHLVMDGWGTSEVLRRWSEIYTALEAGAPPAPREAGGYRSFIEESNAYLSSPGFHNDAAFWAERMPVLPSPLLDRNYSNRQPHQLPAAQLAMQRIARADYARMEQFASGLGATPFSFFLAVLALYFARVGNRQEVVIGVPFLNRSGKRYKSTLGMFVGVFPLRVAIAPGMTVRELIAAVSVALRSAFRHSRYPLSELGRTLQVIRQNRDGLFDVLLSFERQDFGVSFGSSDLVDARQIFSGTARYPLGVTVCEFKPNEDVELVLEGSTACFAGGEVDLLGRRLCGLMAAMIAASDAALEDIELLPAEERWALVEGLHKDVPTHDTTRPFISLFEHQAALSPDALALVWDGGSMDYGTLNRRANHLAHRLAALGAGRDAIVALAIERSPEMVVALLAIAKAGAAFLPLDVDAPLPRLTGIVEESGALALLIREENWERLSILHAHTLIVDAEGVHAATAEQGPAASPEPGDLAYVLFTSGSTGRPKGVMVEHDTLSRRLGWLSRTYDVTWHDRSAQATQLTFDPALIELFLPLISGASVALPPAGRLLPESLAAFAVHHGVTIMAFVPATLSRFLDAAANLPSLKLRVACCGGEVLTPVLANRFLIETGARLYNVYGPTETAIFATAWECKLHVADTALPIGRPVDDTRIYVLDAQLRPLPFGVVGEIFIGGDAVARGYLKRPDLDQDIFLADPFRPGGRMYRTGDRGWLGSEGNLYFTGRLDRQIKLRGYRIELGEIESALLSVQGVSQAAAKLVERNGKPMIHAWVASAAGQSADSLQRILRARLPDYMLPSGISILPSLPSGSTDKIDYAALPDPGLASSAPVARAPNNKLERDILALWETVLGRTPLGIHDNFFDLGGDSLAAIDILAGVDKLTGGNASLHLLTENPTVEQLAAALEAETGAPRLMVRLGVESGRVPVYLAASGHGDLLRFQNLARALGDICDLHMLQPPSDTAIRSMGDLASLYADRIEARGDGVRYLAGFSVGGIAALETSRLLQQRGMPVDGLFLIDTIYPGSVLGGTASWRLLGWLTRYLRVQELSMNGRRLGAMFADAGLVTQVNALGGYRPANFDGPTMLIKSSGLANWERLLFGSWRRLMAENLSERQVSGLHGSIFETGNVGELATVIASRLGASQAGTSWKTAGGKLAG